MESLASGCTGATRAEMPVLCGVSSGSRTLNSRPLSKWTASAIVRAGISCRVIAMSPKPRSRSTTQTRCFPFSDSAIARFTARVVLPTPPFGEKTVTSWPRGPEPPGATGPLSACQTCLARPTAEPEAGQVALLDHLAHAGAKRFREDAGVHPAADQDDARRRPGDPEHVGQGGRGLEVDAGTEDDRVLVGLVGERALELLQAPDHVRRGARHRREQLGVARVVLNDDGHQ